MGSTKTSKEDTNEIEVLKLDTKFINLVDYHAERMTGFSHSSGTVSYESIPPAIGRDDRKMHRNAINCSKQPPPPHYRAQLKTLKIDPKDVSETYQIDLEMFKKIKSQAVRKSHEIENCEVECDMKGMINTLDIWIDTALKNLKSKDEETKKRIEIRLEIPEDKSKQIIVRKITSRLVPKNNQIPIHAYFDNFLNSCDLERISKDRKSRGKNEEKTEVDNVIKGSKSFNERWFSRIN